MLSPPREGRLALITAAKKLPQYFQAHTIYVVTQYPVQAMFHKADFTGRIWKWGVKIGTLVLTPHFATYILTLTQTRVFTN
jgi:hypothetical protein